LKDDLYRDAILQQRNGTEMMHYCTVLNKTWLLCFHHT